VRESRRREASILVAMIPIMVRKSGFREYAARRREARNPAPWQLMPADIERGKFRKKLQFAVGQMVVDPPRHSLPAHAFIYVINQPRHDDARHRSHAAVFAALIPNMSRSIAFIGAAILEVRIAVCIYLRRSVCRSDRKATERGLQRFEQVLTKLASGGDRQVGIIGQVWHTGHRRNLAVQKIAHEKGLRQPNAPECFSASNRSRCLHRCFNASFR